MPIGVGGIGCRAVIPKPIEMMQLGNGKWVALVYFDRFGHTEAPDTSTLTTYITEGFES